MENKSNKKDIRFWVSEIILLAAAAFFAFGMIGYTTIALVLTGIAFLAALYKSIGHCAHRNEKTARTLKRVLTAAVCLAVAGFITVEIPIIASARTNDEPKAEYLIVLGAGVNGTEPSLSLLNRLEAARDYLNTYTDSTAIVSGGQGPGEEITEAQCMRDWLVRNGISEDRIILEPKAVSTYENISLSLKKIKEDGGDPSARVAVASSEYHLYRAKYIAHQLGADPVGVAGHTSYPVLMINYFIREAAAVCATWIM